MPTPDCCASLIIYYFSVLNAATEIQAVHWMLVFPISGALWVFSLSALAPLFGEQRPAFGKTAFRFSMTSLPLSALGPWMTYIAGNTADGFVWKRMIRVALRRAGVWPWPWLNALYVVLGLLVLVAQVYVYRKTFSPRGKKAWQHFFTSAILLSVLACSVGALAAIPLRFFLE